MAHERAPDRQHLTLAAGEAAGKVVLQGLELGEQLPDPLLRPAVGAVGVGGDLEILVDGQVLEAARTGGHERNSPSRPAVRVPAAHIATSVSDLSRRALM